MNDLDYVDRFIGNAMLGFLVALGVLMLGEVVFAMWVVPPQPSMQYGVLLLTAVVMALGWPGIGATLRWVRAVRPLGDRAIWWGRLTGCGLGWLMGVGIISLA
ncbi:hypothetical protein [Burkholderia vietnamiensis]|uniref:hypothetical protein n=1 Tax=Burkholderia vietnamiensis TaxID=60552 RepID=UPI000757905A|nr:hypothetical protein [Burkholderia vietnamiensis]KVF25123.1 hypothetical protein WJ07_12440 [Burkholderia vietnamiensis]KVF65163.1 hypothetical protein WJ17_22410 [Burkholderia vietnamiensis]